MKPHFQDERLAVYHGDCVAVMAVMDPESVDAIVTDPPYDLTSIVKRFGKEGAAPAKPEGMGGAFTRLGKGFMGQTWDGTGVAFRVETWQAALRVLRPGGHLVAFGGTRTSHRMVCAIEDAGFEIRDSLCWMYGSGFPKSLDVSKQIDKAERRQYVLAAIRLGLHVPGNNLHDWTKAEHSPGDTWWAQFKAVLSPEDWQRIEREVVGHNDRPAGWFTSQDGHDVTAPATDAARQWDGWGTALKPAHEPIVLARKPLGAPTVAGNVLQYGTGAINVDGCRIHTEGSEGKPYTVTRLKPGATLNKSGGNWRPEDGGVAYVGETKDGRWPANVLLDEEAAAQLDAATGPQRSGGTPPRRFSDKTRNTFGTFTGEENPNGIGATEGAVSRFFYTSKASASERQGVTHPTVKPVALMRWLCRLVTPPGGVVLDCFAGSGTTRLAALAEGFRCVLIEQNADYLEQLCGRPAQQGFDLEVAG